MKPLIPQMPPHLSMNEYVDFLEKALTDRDSRLAIQQKNLEERIRKRFSLTDDIPQDIGKQSAH